LGKHELPFAVDSLKLRRGELALLRSFVQSNERCKGNKCMKARLFALGFAVAILFPIAAHFSIFFFSAPPNREDFNLDSYSYSVESQTGTKQEPVICFTKPRPWTYRAKMKRCLLKFAKLSQA
jgi:hypothetical protein